MEDEYGRYVPENPRRLVPFADHGQFQLHPKFGPGFAIHFNADTEETVLKYKDKVVTEEVTFKIYVEERDEPYTFIQYPLDSETSEERARSGAAQFMKEGFCASDHEGWLTFYTPNRIELISVSGDLVNMKEED